MEDKLASNFCSACFERPIKAKKRGLCLRCYSRQRYTPRPRKSDEAKKLTTINNLIRKYGDEILNDFDLLNSKPFWNLVDIGNKYGFTRERARQLYKKLYGRAYQKIATKKLKIANSKIVCLNDPRYKTAEYSKDSKQFTGAKYELQFYNQCKKRGIDIKVPCTATIDFKVNGFSVEVKSATPRYYSRAKTKIFSYGMRKVQKDKAAFFACFHSTENCFFIIPTWAISSKTRICINETPSLYHNAKNKYWEYRNAWHLLKG